MTHRIRRRINPLWFALALITAALTISAVTLHSPAWALGLIPLFGAVTTNVLYPVTGTSITAAQASVTTAQVWQVIATADADTTATITHNMAISVADLAAGWPIVVMTPILSQALAALSSWTYTSVTTNTCVFTKLATAGSGNAGAQLQLWISKPHTIIR